MNTRLALRVRRFLSQRSKLTRESSIQRVVRTLRVCDGLAWSELDSNARAQKFKIQNN